MSQCGVRRVGVCPASSPGKAASVSCPAFRFVAALATVLTMAVAAPAVEAQVGTVTEFALPGGSDPYGIEEGPDGNLWFTNLDSGLHRPDHACRDGDAVLRRHHRRSNSRDRDGPGRQPLVHRRLGSDRAHHPDRDRDGVLPGRRPVRDRAGTGRQPVVHEFRLRRNRADHADRHPYVLLGGSNRQYDIVAGPDGNLWYTVLHLRSDRPDHADRDRDGVSAHGRKQAVRDHTGPGRQPLVRSARHRVASGGSRRPAL